MKKSRNLSFLIILMAASACDRTPDQSATRDIITDIDSSDEPRTVPFIYYVDEADVVRGECSEGASLVRAQCTNNLKRMDLVTFEKRVANDVNQELENLVLAVSKAEQSIAKAKEESNSLLVVNHDLQKQIDKKNDQVLGVGGLESQRVSKATDLSGLEEQLVATDASLLTATGTQQQQLQAIKSKLLIQIAAVKKDLETLQKSREVLEKEIAGLKTSIAANSTKIDQLIAVQDEENKKIPDLKTSVAVQQSDLAEIESTFALLKADLIPYEINTNSTTFESNKRWIKRFDMVMTGDAGSEQITIGDATEFSGTSSINSGFLIMREITVSAKMDVIKFGVIAKKPLSQVHMALYKSGSKNLIVATQAFSMTVGINEVAPSFFTTIEPGTYLLGIQGNGGLGIGQGSSTSQNFAAPMTFPSLSTTLPNFVSVTQSSLNLYMIGDKF